MDATNLPVVPLSPFTRPVRLDMGMCKERGLDPARSHRPGRGTHPPRERKREREGRSGREGRPQTSTPRRGGVETSLSSPAPVGDHLIISTVQSTSRLRWHPSYGTGGPSRAPIRHVSPLLHH
eukprot:scaffold100_cov323-Pavlova_lutheri.AAC.34